MSDIEKAAAEALAIAKGESPAARIYLNGHFYVPQAEIERLRAALRGLLWYANRLELNVYDPSEWPVEHEEVKNARAALGEKP